MNTSQPQKIWTESEIVSMLQTRDAAVVKAVIAIYNRQTSTEQSTQSTHCHNNIGFNAADARFMSYCAQYAIKHKQLSGKFLEKARTKIIKYRKQLVDIANNK